MSEIIVTKNKSKPKPKPIKRFSKDRLKGYINKIPPWMDKIPMYRRSLILVGRPNNFE